MNNCRNTFEQSIESLSIVSRFRLPLLFTNRLADNTHCFAVLNRRHSTLSTTAIDFPRMHSRPIAFDQYVVGVACSAPLNQVRPSTCTPNEMALGVRLSGGG